MHTPCSQVTVPPYLAIGVVGRAKLPYHRYPKTKRGHISLAAAAFLSLLNTIFFQVKWDYSVLKIKVV